MSINAVSDSELPSSILPKGYKEFLEEIKGRMQEAQIRASLPVNKLS